MSPNNGYKTTCNTLYHKVIEIASILSRLWLFFYFFDVRFSFSCIEIIKIKQMQSKSLRNYYASSVFVSQRPIACWGSAPIPLNDAVSIELNLKNFILYELDILTNVLLPVWRGLLFTTVSFL